MNHESTDLTGAPAHFYLGSKAKTALRRLWKFPRTWREVRSLGWKFVVTFIVFYLVRDTILYIIVPYLIYSGLLTP